MSVEDSRLLYENLYKGEGSNSDSLPPQAILKKKKNDKWVKDVMDRLESIGLRQINKNFVFNDFYAMAEGDLSYMEYGMVPDILHNIAATTEELDLPHYIQHYDLIGRVANYLSSKYNDTKNKFRVDFLDPISENEFDRDLNNKVFEYARQVFEMETQAGLARMGIDPTMQFETEEEQQQYLQQIEQAKAALSLPPQIKSAMEVEWRPEIAKWVESTLNRDNLEYRKNSDIRKKFIDRFFTGRFFNHYNIGYDYYEIERLDPREVFFSEDADIKYPQDAEYVGWIKDMSPSKIVDTYGHLLTKSQIEKILNNDEYSSYSSSYGDEGIGGIIEDVFPKDDEMIPSQNYYDRQSSIAVQNMFGVPLEETVYFGRGGEQHTKPSWIEDYHFSVPNVGQISRHFRRDIEGRKDTIRVTRAYWRSYDIISYLYYVDEQSGFAVFDMVTEELLEGFLKEKNIKKLNKLSLNEFMEKMQDGTLEPNSIVFSYAPKIYHGIKLSTANTKLKKDIYLDGKELPFQIKGRSNIYRVQIPITGIITTSEAKKMMPYQKEHNYQMNLMRSLTEKEIGIFWMFDINLLPSDFQGSGDSHEVLDNVVNMAREIGLVPMDTSRQNMMGRNAQAPGMQPIDVTFIPQIQQKQQMAEYYKRLALEQIGINEESLNQPSQFSTAEGIKQGQVNSFAQIEHLFDEMDEAILKDMEVNINVFQYAQSNGKDRSMSYLDSDTGRIIRESISTDEDYGLRQFGLIPLADTKRRKELEDIKNYIFSTNTFSGGLDEMVEILMSDSVQSMRGIVHKAAIRQQQEIEAQREHERELEQMKIDAEKESTEALREYELYKQDRELENRIQVATIKRMGELEDRAYKESAPEDVERISEKYLKNKTENRKLDLQKATEESNSEYRDEMLKLKREEMEERKRKNDLREREIETKRFTSVINKN